MERIVEAERGKLRMDCFKETLFLMMVSNVISVKLMKTGAVISEYRIIRFKKGAFDYEQEGND